MLERRVYAGKPSTAIEPLRTDAIKRQLEQSEVLRKDLEKEKRLGRLDGPIHEPYYDGRWFKNHWVSP